MPVAMMSKTRAIDWYARMSTSAATARMIANASTRRPPPPPVAAVVPGFAVPGVVVVAVAHAAPTRRRGMVDVSSRAFARFASTAGWGSSMIRTSGRFAPTSSTATIEPGVDGAQVCVGEIPPRAVVV